MKYHDPNDGAEALASLSESSISCCAWSVVLKMFNDEFVHHLPFVNRVFNKKKTSSEPVDSASLPPPSLNILRGLFPLVCLLNNQ